jgi:hypothetical protein
MYQIQEEPTPGAGNGNEPGTAIGTINSKSLVKINGVIVQLPYANHCGKYPSCFQCGKPNGKCTFNDHHGKQGNINLDITF